MAFKSSQRIRALFAGIGCIFGLTATLCAADLSIGHVEITQGLQTANNDIPLIRNKPTVIRVFPVVTGQPELRQVSARLHAIRAGQSLPGSPIMPTRGTATIGNTVDRTTDQGALIFDRLPPDWYAQDTQFLIEAVPPAGFTDDDPANDRFPRTGFLQATFVESGSLAIRFMTVRYRNSGPDAFPASVVTRRDAVQWLQAIFPIAPDKVSYSPWLTTELVFENPGPPSSSGGTRDLNGAALISELNTIWTDGQAPPEILFAWTPNDSFIVNGNSDPWYTLPPLPAGLGQVAFANSNAATYRRTLAHEIAHNLGINCHHSSRLEGDAIGYDVNLVHPLNASTSVLRLTPGGDGLFDVMTPEQVEANAWIVPSTYRQLLAALISPSRQSVQCDNHPPLTFTRPPFTKKSVTPGSTLVALRGEIREDGGSFFNSYEVRAAGPYLVAASRTPDDSQGTHEVRILNRTGGLLQSIRWTPPIQHGDSTAPLTSTPFTWFVPKSNDVGAVLLFRGVTLLDTIRVRDREPVVEPPQRSTVRIGPSFGGRPQELLTVKWREVPSGPDGAPFDQKELRHRLSFSRDGGETWIPVAANISGSQDGQVSLEFNQALLPGCQNCRLKVTTSDGYNVTETVGQPFTLPNRPPLAEVVSSGSKIKIFQGDPLRLVGEAFDPEDGPLSGNQLVWWSDTQGDLGRGTILRITSLPPGVHKIQLTANDTAQETSDPAVIEVEVLPADQP